MFHAVLGHLADGADLGSPFVHTSTLNFFLLGFHVLKVFVFNQSLHTPVVFSVLLATRGHINLQLLSFIFERVVWVACHSDF